MDLFGKGVGLLQFLLVFERLQIQILLVVEVQKIVPRTGTVSLGMVSAVPRGLVVLRDVTFRALASIFRLPLLFFCVGHEFYGPSVNIDFFAR